MLATLFTLVVIGSAIFASSASAQSYCGPEFHNKAEVVAFFKSNAQAAAGLEKYLRKYKASNFNADDEGIIAYLEDPHVKAKITPKGYKLKANTYCPNGPGSYTKYNGLLDNMGGKLMLWYCYYIEDGGRKCVPLLKGYCVNAGKGPPAWNSPPKKHQPPKKCKCKKKKPKPKKVCKVNGKKMTIGNCIKQTNKAKMECEARGNHYWDSNVLVCVQVQQNGVCSAQSGVVNGDNNTVYQDVNCGTEVNTCVYNSCNVTPPPPPPPPCVTNCHPEPPDHGPQISCIYPPHIYVGGSQYMWCEASDPDGDTLNTPNVVGDSHLQASSTIPVQERWDKSSCPKGVSCYRTTLWGKSAGQARIVATVTANGKEAKTEGYVSVVADEF